MAIPEAEDLKHYFDAWHIAKGLWILSISINKIKNYVLSCMLTFILLHIEVYVFKDKFGILQVLANTLMQLLGRRTVRWQDSGGNQ